MMARILRIILLAILAAKANSYDGLQVSDLPTDTAAELKYIVENYPDVKANCTGHPVARSADFFLYNRNNPTKPIVLDANTLTQIKPENPVIILIHGWLSSATSSHIKKLKDEYIGRYDCNLIVVDWSKQSFQPYTKAYCDVPGIARVVTQLLCTMVTQLDISLDTVRLVGHSIGGQIAGFTGQFAKAQCKQEIGRITALDPAGLIFQYLFDDDEKLDKKDALFVDVIHTDGDSTGAWRNCGDIDFHPNCGRFQPECPIIKEVISNTTVSDILCSTLRSLEYMAESVTSNNFIGVSCGRCPEICRQDIISEVYTIMGEECKKPIRTMKFYIPTKTSSPYAEGWDPFTYNIE